MLDHDLSTIDRGIPVKVDPALPLWHRSTFVASMKLLRAIPRPLRNRYGLVSLGLLAWLALFDRNDLWTTWKNHRELDRMHEQKEWYSSEIERSREQLNELSSNKRLLEKFARERYLMKRDNEDIFVLVPEK